MDYLALDEDILADLQVLVVKHKDVPTFKRRRLACEDYAHDGNTVWVTETEDSTPYLDRAILLCDSTATAERLAFLLNLDGSKI